MSIRLSHSRVWHPLFMVKSLGLTCDLCVLPAHCTNLPCVDVEGKCVHYNALSQKRQQMRNLFKSLNSAVHKGVGMCISHDRLSDKLVSS